jgi:hypothetical protein
MRDGVTRPVARAITCSVQDPLPRDAARAEQLGLTALALLVTLPVAGWAMLACGLRLSALPLAVAILVALACAHRLTPRYLATTLIVCASLAALGLVCAWYFDLSWDGQAYHQQAIQRMAGGWNPLWDPPLDENLRPNDIWVNHYPRAAWIAEAVLFRATGHIEVAKLLQLAWLATALLLAYAALRGLEVARPAALAIATLAACNPVALCQFLSFYVDGLMASTLTVIAALTALWWRRPRSGLLVAIAAALVFLCNLKFTGAVYAGLYACGLGAATLAWRRTAWKPVVLTVAAALLLGLLAVGYGPYVTNTTGYGHPFFPIAGPHAEDVLATSVAPSLRSQNRLALLAHTLFSRSYNTLQIPRWKAPFFVDTGEVIAFAAPDVRIAGFGPLFSGALLLSLVALAIGAARRAPGALPVLAIVAAILGSVLLNQGLTVARYVPQLWLVPICALVVARPRRLAQLAGAALFLNLFLVGGAYLGAQTLLSSRHHAQLASLQTARGALPIEVRWKAFDTNRERLREAGIPFVEPPQLSCDKPGHLLFSESEVCLSGPGGPAPGTGHSPPSGPSDSGHSDLR